MKKLIWMNFVVAFAVTFLSVPVSAQDTSSTIVRPFQVEAKVSGAQIAKPGAYTISVGDWLQLGYGYSVTPQAMPKQLSFHTSGSEVLDASEPVVKNVVSPGLMGAGAKEFCFRAAKAGQETVTLSIDGNEYQYSITVEGSDDDSSEAGPCTGVYTAIQVKGKVFIFASGVQPSAGYETYLEKAKIAIWPPQYSLMCKKPAGLSAQVLSPFSVHESFDADEPVGSVVVIDSDGKQTIKVMQVK